MEVRPYTAADAAACCDVINAAVAGMDGLNEAARAFVIAKNTPERVDAELQPLTAVVCVVDGRVAGVGALDGDLVKRVYVAPAAQGTGAGDAVMSSLEAAARVRDVAEVRVEASPSSVTFYERRGYERVGDRRLTIGEAVFDYVEMRLET